MKKALSVCTSAGLYLFLACSTQAADVNDYLVIKGQVYLQAGTNIPVLASNAMPFVARATVHPASSNSVTGATVQGPKGQVKTLTNFVDSFEFSQVYSNKTALDAAVGAGAYAFTIETANDGEKKPKLTLAVDAYPSTPPHVSNWADTQNVDAALPLTIVWDPFVGGTTNDYVSVKISDTNDNTVYQTPGILKDGVLNGTDLSVVVPADTFAPSQVYSARIQFFKQTGLFTTNYPGANGLAGYYKQTTFTLNTLATAPAAGRIQFSTSGFSALENAGSATISVVRSDTNGQVTVGFVTTDGTATQELDYAGVNTTITLDDGVASTNISIGLVNDFRLEGNETVHLTLYSPAGGAELGSLSNATLTIIDNELPSAGVFNFTPVTASATEAGPMVLLNVSRTGGTTGAVSVTFATSDGTATDGADYIATNGILDFTSGLKSKSFGVRILQDSVVDPNETFHVTLSLPTGGAALGSNTAATVTIKDDDVAGQITFASAAYSAGENAGTARIVLNRLGGKASNAGVTLSTANLTATDGLDYVGTNVTVTFGSNELTKTFLLQLLDDTLPEGDETVALHISSPSGGATLGKITNAVLTLVENDPSFTFTNAAYTVSEAGKAISINVIRAGGLTNSASVSYRTVNGSAISTNDYLGTNVVLTFPPKTTVKTITIPIINDTLVEGSENFFVQLYNPQNGAQLGTLTNATVTITDDDVGGVIGFSASTYSVAEAGGKPVVMIKRTGGLASGVSVDLTMTGGTATSGVDYTNFTTTLTFNAGETSKTINVPVINDAIHEANETILLSLGNPHGGGAVGGISNATVTIQDDDVAGTVAFSSALYSTNENAGAALITVTRSGGAAGGVTVDFATHNDSAIAGQDYTATNGTLTFGPGETTKTFSVVITNDTVAEGNETLNLTLTNPGGGATLGVISSSVLSIVDDESSVAFTNTAVSAVEGSNVVVTVTRSGALTTQVSVDIATVAGTATAGSDFNATNATLVFPPNTSTKSVTIHLNNDPDNDGGETFAVKLTNPTGGVQVGSPSNLTVTIQNAPDPNGVPEAGAKFLTTTAGITFTALPSSVIATLIATATPVVSIFGTTGGASGQQTVEIAAVPARVGTINLLQNGDNGTFVFDKLTFPSSNVHYSTDKAGTSGTVTIDVLDTANHVCTGRFNVVALRDSDNALVHITGSFRALLQ